MLRHRLAGRQLSKQLAELGGLLATQGCLAPAPELSVKPWEWAPKMLHLMSHARHQSNEAKDISLHRH